MGRACTKLPQRKSNPAQTNVTFYPCDSSNDHGDTTQRIGYFVFVRDATGEVHLTISGSIWDPTGYRRIAWYQSPWFQLALVAIAFLALLWRALASIAQTIVPRWRRAGLPPAPPSLLAAWRRTGLASWLLGLVPPVAIAGLATTQPPWFSVPWFVAVILTLLLLGVGLGIVTTLPALRGLRAAWPAWRRATLLAAVAGAWSLGAFSYTWNLLGYRW